MIGTSMPIIDSFSTMRGTAAADSGLFTVTRTNSDPARHSSDTCFTVPATSAVSVLVIDWTTIGCPEPTSTWPIAHRAGGAPGMGSRFAHCQAPPSPSATRSARSGRSRA